MTAYARSGGLWKPHNLTVKQAGVWKPQIGFARAAGVWKPFADMPTTLLLHFDGVNGSTVFADNSVKGLTVVAAGDTKIDTAQSMFGGASAYFDGTGDYLYCNDADAFSTPGDFTVEVWARFPARGGAFSTPIFDTRANGSTAGIYLAIDDLERLALWVNGAARVSTGVLSVNVWHHLAVCRGAGVFRLFVDGGLIGSYTDANAYTTNTITIGTYVETRNTGSNKYMGHLDEFRFTKGLARYTTAFTVPTGPFTAF